MGFGRVDEVVGSRPEARIEAFAALSVCPGLTQEESSSILAGLAFTVSAEVLTGRATPTALPGSIRLEGVSPFLGRLGRQAFGGPGTSQVQIGTDRAALPAIGAVRSGIRGRIVGHTGHKLTFKPNKPVGLISSVATDFQEIGIWT